MDGSRRGIPACQKCDNRHQQNGCRVRHWIARADGVQNGRKEPAGGEEDGEVESGGNHLGGGVEFRKYRAQRKGGRSSILADPLKGLFVHLWRAGSR